MDGGTWMGGTWMGGRWTAMVFRMTVGGRQ
jgi:hypothetical protein